MLSILSDKLGAYGGKWLQATLNRMANAELLPDEHPVWRTPIGQQFADDKWAFAHAAAGLVTIEMSDQQRFDALQKLAACFTYNNPRALTVFNAALARTRFVETEAQMPSTH
jgi:hypothetical protein